MALANRLHRQLKAKNRLPNSFLGSGFPRTLLWQRAWGSTRPSALSCHNEGEEGAPALTDADEWARRATRGEATLIKRAIDGFIGDDGEMPARGGTPHTH